jgi:hypothetical protein
MRGVTGVWAEVRANSLLEELYVGKELRRQRQVGGIGTSHLFPSHLHDHLILIPLVVNIEVDSWLVQKWGAKMDHFLKIRAPAEIAQLAVKSKQLRWQEALVIVVLWRYYEALLHPASPIYVAESKAVGGLGLFVWRGAAVVMGGSLFKGHLWGVPFEVAEEDFAKLQVGGYPSLYCTPNGWAHILCGPLALANHCCAAPLSFSLPKRIAVAPSSSPSLTATTSAQATRLRGGGILVEEFAGLCTGHPAPPGGQGPGDYGQLLWPGGAEEGYTQWHLLRWCGVQVPDLYCCWQRSTR